MGALRAVAVVHIPIQNRHCIGLALLERDAGRNCDRVEEAKALGPMVWRTVVSCVVARWAHERKRAARAVASIALQHVKGSVNHRPASKTSSVVSDRRVVDATGSIRLGLLTARGVVSHGIRHSTDLIDVLLGVYCEQLVVCGYTTLVDVASV
eukprot:scaffold25_cov65-Phaeocystis_antarctica.AAC.4